MAYKTWTKIDNGREGLWNLDVWLGVIHLIKKHEGANVYDEGAEIYTDLERLFPGKGWKKHETNGAFRPLFRDYPKPWTNTSTISLENQTFRLTSLGKKLANNQIGPSDVFKELLLNWEEDGEHPFQILASAILSFNKPLRLHDFYHGVMLGWRPGDDINAAIANSQTSAASSDTEERRLKLMLRIMELAGCISQINEQWFPWDRSLLKEISASHGTAATSENEPNLDKLVSTISADLHAAGLLTDAGVTARFAASLLAKRFAILTGLAGSGKTKLAHAFAAWIAISEAQYKVVAVGADWTNNENLLGYADALQSGRYCKPPSGALDLILAAEADPTRPYFLILDEMNLSHVERYFADMLSAIESGKKVALHGANTDLDGVPPSIDLADNLFIIGTVNVDETTYMFSPKVLDRANVIEFRTRSDQISQFMESPTKIHMHQLSGKGSRFGEQFVAHARLPEPAIAELPTETSGGVDRSTELKERMVEVFDSLASIGAEFGFRTAFEISRFVYFHATLLGPGWKFEEALDAQVLQKLLPKLHGSERRLRPVLTKLGEFCDKYSLSASKEKIERMSDRLKDGFTSFAEA